MGNFDLYSINIHFNKKITVINVTTYEALIGQYGSLHY